MGVHDHVREMKHTERTLVFPSPPVQKLTGECFSTTISGFVWVNDWLKVKVCLEYHPNDPRDHCAQSLQSFSSLRTADAFPVVVSLPDDRKYVCCSQATEVGSSCSFKSASVVFQ